MRMGCPLGRDVWLSGDYWGVQTVGNLHRDEDDQMIGQVAGMARSHRIPAAWMLRLGLAIALLAIVPFAAMAQEPPLAVARFDDNGALQLPEGLEKWVFMGASLGMGYNPKIAFDPDTPGNFQTVLMEPTAYAAFERTGTFPEGTMFAMLVHAPATDVSINQNGFVMGGSHGIEIHLKDKARFPDTGFNFFFFAPNETRAAALPVPNDCTTCHARDGAYDATFTQFYPTLRDRVPKR